MIELIKLIITGAKWLVPPIGASDLHQYGWRIRVALVACCALLLAVLGIASSHGLVPHVSGFASEHRVDEIWASNLTLQIQETRAQQCATADALAKSLLSAKLNWLMIEYDKVAPEPYRPVGCDEIIPNLPQPIH